MPQLEFTPPDFIDDNSAEDIHERMMEELPPDIDDMPGGFPYDLTMPSAIQKSELIEFHLVRALMIAFPQYAWDEWLDLHGQQVHVKRHEGKCAEGILRITGEPGTEIGQGTKFLVAATDDSPAIEYISAEDCVIGDSGTVSLKITATEPGADFNVRADSVCIMEEPVDEITEITNPEAITGGTSDESNDDYYDRIAAEYANKRTYIGNDADYKRWAQEAGAGDCIVISCPDGRPGTVRLVLVDQNGQPASTQLTETVYRYIVSPEDRSKRLLPTACAEISCVPATTTYINYSCTGLLYGDTTSIDEIKREFKNLLKRVYTTAKAEGILRYNDVRPLISGIAGVEDFDEFLMNGAMKNIPFAGEEYPETGSCEFS